HKILGVHILPFLFVVYLAGYSVMQIFVLANLKYSVVLLESYFSISHIAHRVCPDYTLINLYPLYFAVGGGHFADTAVVRQSFLVPMHLYEPAFLPYYLSSYLLDFGH